MRSMGYCKVLHSYGWCLLWQAGDVTLHCILNHIAYVNRSALPIRPSMVISPPKSRKSQVQKVLNATYITALLGLVLCVADMGRLCGPYGLMAPTSNTTGKAPVSTSVSVECKQRWQDNIEMILDKSHLMMWTGSIWFSIVTSSRILWICRECLVYKEGRDHLEYLSDHQPLRQSSLWN